MIFKLNIDRECREEIIANVHQRTPLIDEIERMVTQDGTSEQLTGYTEDENFVGDRTPDPEIVKSMSATVSINKTDSCWDLSAYGLEYAGFSSGRTMLYAHYAGGGASGTRGDARMRPRAVLYTGTLCGADCSRAGL